MATLNTAPSIPLSDLSISDTTSQKATFKGQDETTLSTQSVWSADIKTYLYLGEATVKNICLGDIPVKAIYLGDQLIYNTN